VRPSKASSRSAGAGRLTDARTALAGVAREAARVAADAPTPAAAVHDGQTRAHQTAAGYGLDPARLQVSIDPQGFARGGSVRVVARYRVALDDIPSLRLFPAELTLTSAQLEPIDPYKSRPTTSP